MSHSRRAVLLLVCSSALLLLPAAAGGQQHPDLVSALRLAQEGLGDSARATVARMLAGTDPADTLYPQVLYTRALVTADPGEMRVDLQRVAVEYTSSNWADDALLRLALLEYAAGQLDASARHLERIELDHSTSPLYARAAHWAGRVYFELQRAEDACRWLRQGRQRTGDDVELAKQLDFYAARCVGVADGRTSGPASADTIAAARTDTARIPDSLPAGPPARPRPGPPAFRIQIAAVNTAATADSIAARARATGIEAVVVREPPYFKVRVGGYATRAEAAAALPAVRARFRAAAFVVTSRE